MTSDPYIRIAVWSTRDTAGPVQTFLERPAFDEEAERTARDVLSNIRRRGGTAVSEYARRFDGVSLRPSEFRVRAAELSSGGRQLSRESRTAVNESCKRVARFSRAAMKRDWSMPTPRGGSLGERFVPLERVGVYVPGGAAPLVSTVVMTVTLARTAGVPEIVVCTPCGRKGEVDPAMLYAFERSGATEVYRVGGIQAIGLMAYGTRSIRKVQKIVGPGGTYVTAAKRLVYGHVALDLVAGPSEIAVLADDSADPRHVAADMLSQAEHGTGWEKALLVTPSRGLARAVARQLVAQAKALPRWEAVRTVLEKGTMLAVVSSLDEGVELCNRFAPEHLELMIRRAKNWLKRVRNAGAVFVGKWSPEPTGDFVAGPSHVLPTGGSATMFSGLTVDDFRKRQSVVAFTRSDLKETLPVIEAFARIEGLEAHGRSARVRLEKSK